jgi:hypothetical protein
MRTLAISWGKYGGFYYTRQKIAGRLCLGWIAIIWLSVELDRVIEWAGEEK